MSNHLKKVLAVATLNAGTLTKKTIHVNHSDMVDAKEQRTTLYRKLLVNINARIHPFKKVCHNKLIFTYC